MAGAAIFGPPGDWPEQDLIAFSDEFDPGLVLAAYSSGVFPMPLSRSGFPGMGWWSPLHRGVLPLDALRVTKSLRKSARRFTTTADTAFAEVLERCADPNRPYGWISDEIKSVYSALHHAGHVHSVETWDAEGRLVGGLYGVSLGGLFAGESMFHDPVHGRDASKVALLALVGILADEHAEDRIIDVQWQTDHPATLGVIEVERDEYLGLLAEAIAVPDPAWPRREEGHAGLPEVEALRTFLSGACVGKTVARTELVAFASLKTFQVPLSALHGLEVDGVERRGKFVCLSVSGLWLVFHLARGGWPTWKDAMPAKPSRPGRGPLAARVVFDDDSGFELTEYGTQKRLALYVVAALDQVPGIATLGPVPLGDEFTPDVLDAILAKAGRGQLKGAAAGPEDHRGDRERVLRRDPARREAEPVQAVQRAECRRTRDSVRRDPHRAGRGCRPVRRPRGEGTEGGQEGEPPGARPCRPDLRGLWAPRSPRCPSPTVRCSTVRAVRPAASCSPIGDCPAC